MCAMTPTNHTKVAEQGAIEKKINIQADAAVLAMCQNIPIRRNTVLH